VSDPQPRPLRVVSDPWETEDDQFDRSKVYGLKTRDQAHHGEGRTTHVTAPFTMHGAMQALIEASHGKWRDMGHFYRDAAYKSMHDERLRGSDDPILVDALKKGELDRKTEEMLSYYADVERRITNFRKQMDLAVDNPDHLQSLIDDHQDYILDWAPSDQSKMRPLLLEAARLLDRVRARLA
jgi:hypothetical protein